MSFITRKKGIYIEGRKNTENQSVVPITLPKAVAISMNQTEGKPCRVIVNPGQKVKVGQVIGAGRGDSSVPVHSSVSGTVTAIRTCLDRSGLEDTCVIIESDGKQTVYDRLSPPDPRTGQQFIEAVRASGLVCPGDTGKPMAVKLDTQRSRVPDTLIVNGVQCEPFVTSDQRNMLSYGKDIIEGAAIIMKWLEIKNCIIAVSSGSKDILSLYTRLCAGLDDFTVRSMPRRFPMNRDEMLIREITGKLLMPGKEAEDMGMLILDSSTVIKLSQYMLTGMPLVSKTVTVDGDGIGMPMNVEVPIGTAISDVLAFCGADLTAVAKVTAGDPMTGKTVADISMPVLKTDNAFVCYSDIHTAADRQTACINCGRCVRSCPQGLFPAILYKAWKERDRVRLEKHLISACTHCGCCTFVCPARNPLSFELSLARTWAEESREEKI